MARYYEGYYQTREQVSRKNEQQLLDLIDNLFGRDELPENYTLQQLRIEALGQLEIEWRTPEGHQAKKDSQALADAIITSSNQYRPYPIPFPESN